MVGPSCKLRYQLKGLQSRIDEAIADGGYATMMNAIRMDSIALRLMERVCPSSE